jgi:seryl-tRNA synthetase
MIDLRAARNDPESFRAALSRRGAAAVFDELLAADESWRALVPQVDELRSLQKSGGKPNPEQIEAMRQAKARLKELEDELAAAEAEREALLVRVPNLPHDSVPDGADEEDAVAVRYWGEPPPIAEPKDHLELGRFDMERAARVSGARFGYLIGGTALLAFALYRFVLDRLVAMGFTPMLPPVLVREEAMYGTGFFPSEKVDYYEIPSDGLYLVGTSEVPMAGLYMGEILDALPLRYTAYSSCFRREAGAAGRDTRGMFRVHQFQKVEMFVFSRPEESWDEHERLLAIEEELVQALGLPYRVMNIAAGDLGASTSKRYDIEAWFPSQGRYREITSCSNTTDFQARRLGIRWRAGRGLETPHTLNGTAATDRWVLAVLENFQQADGSVAVLGALQRLGAPARVDASS